MELKNGDLLFRFAGKEHIGGKYPLSSKIPTPFDKQQMRVITDAQKNFKNKLKEAILKYNKEIEVIQKDLEEKVDNMLRNQERIAHVGVYVDKIVWEIGRKGVKKNKIEERKNKCDLVVRFTNEEHSKKLAKVAVDNWNYKGFVGYPWSHIKEMGDRKKLTLFSKQDYINLAGSDRERKQTQDNDKITTEVVCSHHVNALCYKAFYRGSIATATKKENYKFFRLMPATLIFLIRNNFGMYNGYSGSIVGVQYMGYALSIEEMGGFSADRVKANMDFITGMMKTLHDRRITEEIEEIMMDINSQRLTKVNF